MKVLKNPVVFSILLHLCMQVGMLIQVKVYGVAPGIYSDVLILALPIVFGICTYRCLKDFSKKQLLTTVLCFFTLYAVFYLLNLMTGYFPWLFDYGIDNYETRFNAMADGLVYTISAIVVFIVRFVKLRNDE